MSEPKMPRTIAVDFDNTLFETDWPEIKKTIWPVINAARTAKEEGAELILWTTREGEYLVAALEACENVGLTFDAVNANTATMTKLWGTDPRKVGATEYWDDRSVNFGLGNPCLVNTRPQRVAQQPKGDAVSHPQHCTQRDIDCIDAVRAVLGLRGFTDYCKGRIITALWVHQNSGDLDDLCVVETYIKRIIDAEEKAAAECAT